jgi:hypothetical protein
MTTATATPDAIDVRDHALDAYAIMTTDLGQCCELDSKRYALDVIHMAPCVDSDQVYLASTNSKSLAVVRTEGACSESINQRLIPRHHIPRLKTHWKQGVNSAQLYQGKWKSTVQPECDQRRAYDNGRFPTYRDLFQKVDKDTCVSVSIDAEELLKVAKALNSVEDGSTVVTLLISTEQTEAESAIPVRPSGKNGDTTNAIGLLMPCATAWSSSDLSRSKTVDDWNNEVETLHASIDSK